MSNIVQEPIVSVITLSLPYNPLTYLVIGPIPPCINAKPVSQGSLPGSAFLPMLIRQVSSFTLSVTRHASDSKHFPFLPRHLSDLSLITDPANVRSVHGKAHSR